MKDRKTSIFTRNSDAGSLIDIFLISAVSSILLIRTFLHFTGYPQIGGGAYHIAHVLWGGMLMMLAVFMSITYFGRKIQRLVALFGGLGFGIFIDELGKLITKDNNYFYKPTIGLIYATFAGIYILSTYLVRNQKFTKVEYRLNALRLAEDVIRNDLDKNEKKEIEKLLHKADLKNPLTEKIVEFISNIDVADTTEASGYRKVVNKIDCVYDDLLRTRRTDRLIQIFSFLVIFGSVVGMYILFHRSYSSLIDFIEDNPTKNLALEKGQIICTFIAQVFAYLGAIFIIKNRYRAFSLFNIALMINIFLTQFFMFARIQFSAIPFFLGNLGLLFVVRFVLAREQYLKTKKV